MQGFISMSMEDAVSWPGKPCTQVIPDDVMRVSIIIG